MEKTHPLCYISLDGLAMATNCSAPSSPPVVRVEKRQLSWQRGVAEGKRGHIHDPIIDLLQ